MKKSTVVVIWGLVTTATNCAYSYFLNSTGLAYVHSGLSYVSFLIVFLGMLLAMLHYRNKVGGGFASFGQLYGLGMIVVLFVTVLFTAYFAIYLHFTPDYFDKMMAAAQAQMVNKGYSNDQIETGLNWVKLYMTPSYILIGGLFFYGLLGAILGLLAAAIVNKPKPFFEEDLTNIQ